MTEINPQESKRAEAYALWLHAPMPMLTFFKTLDVTRLLRYSRRKGLKFNMLMCWCIGKAASGIEEFYTKYLFHIVQYSYEFGGRVGAHAHMVFLSL